MNQTEVRATLLGSLFLFGLPALLLLWVISFIPLAVWLFLLGVVGSALLLIGLIPPVMSVLIEKKSHWPLIRDVVEARKLAAEREEEARRRKDTDERHYREYIRRGRKY